MDLSRIPFFDGFSPEIQAELLQSAERLIIEAGKVLFYEGDHAENLYVLVSGPCTLQWGQESRGAILPGELLDPAATLGGLPHSVRVTAVESCELLYWTTETLMRDAAFGAAARRFLAGELLITQRRCDELAAPISFAGDGSIVPGPFRFENVTMIFAFCETESAVFGAHLLPDGLRILQRPGRDTTPVLVALADFPKAYPEDHAQNTFRYTETTFFLPVRHQSAFGFFVPYIYPSAWEPILIGRDIYGFPKQLGETIFAPNTASLSVNETRLLRISWDGGEAASETRLVRALSDWLGIQGRLTAAAFQAGEVLRKMTRLPAYRRVDVYNRKRIPAVDSTAENPIDAVHQLTRATFGVLRWQQISRLDNLTLTVSGQFAGLTLREAYRTQLDMRLSAGRVVKDYLHVKS